MATDCVPQYLVSRIFLELRRMCSPFITKFSEGRIIHTVWGPVSWGLSFYFFLQSFLPSSTLAGFGDHIIGNSNKRLKWPKYNINSRKEPFD